VFREMDVSNPKSEVGSFLTTRRQTPCITWSSFLALSCSSLYICMQCSLFAEGGLTDNQLDRFLHQIIQTIIPETSTVLGKSVSVLVK